MTNLIEKLIYSITQPLIAFVVHNSTRTRIVIVHHGQVLLIRHRLGGQGWDLLGGGVKKYEELLTAAIREVEEEVGVRLKPADVKKLYERDIKERHYKYRAVYFCAELNKKPDLKLQRHEVAEARWVSRKDLSEYKLLKGVRRAIVDCLE
jgi:8-oxo-dGTP pyrophosphatase MutT (NUDIX family)